MAMISHQTIARARCNAPTSPPLLRRYFFATAILAVIISACSPTQLPTDTMAAETPTETVPAVIITSEPTATIGIQPTLAPVPGTVNVANGSCRMGPGGGYLLRQILHQGDAVEVRASLDLNTNWILVRVSESGANCWVNTDFIDFPAESSFNIITDPHIVLAYSTYYSPLRGVVATRNGNVVRVRWDPMILREDDQFEDTHYVLAAWVCQNGQFVFRSAGSNEFAVFIRDEQGCDESSHGLVMGAEKHGYTMPVVVDWP